MGDFHLKFNSYRGTDSLASISYGNFKNCPSKCQDFVLSVAYYSTDDLYGNGAQREAQSTELQREQKTTAELLKATEE